MIRVLDILDLPELVLSVGGELVYQGYRLLLRLPLRVIQYLLTIQDSVCLFLVSEFHIVVELLSELLDLYVMRLENLVILREIREGPALLVLSHYPRYHSHCAVDLG